ncbi:hypothetical protein DAPPUDRAFT_246424 [Daphnia pulex]|uniref:Uncharacterized protein n=1 Tax=Daphnia pulex TaxID=6669 RepID=E9GQG7_DAPPU|nr:hypothetical protein DAPPUDRAFT_246424 [Daphnia pulex]|eukprot:EFX78340.1 hypothetical protein DAPPUDRAFT_246424 [Daphnia pulex]
MSYQTALSLRPSPPLRQRIVGATVESQSLIPGRGTAIELNNRGDVGSSSNTPSSQQPGAPDSGGWLSSLALDRCGKCHQFLFSRTESILLIGSIYYATTTNNIKAPGREISYYLMQTLFLCRLLSSSVAVPPWLSSFNMVCCCAGGGDVFHPEMGTGSLNLFQSSATTRSHATPMKDYFLKPARGAVHWQQANIQRGSWVPSINVDWCSYIQDPDYPHSL